MRKLRRISVWIDPDHAVYAQDEDSGEVFHLPRPTHDQYPPSVKRAIARTMAEGIGDFLFWLAEKPGMREWHAVGDAGQADDGTYYDFQVYPRKRFD